MIKDFAVYDLEWTMDLRVKFIGYYDGDQFEGFRTVEDFVAFACQARARVLYAHAGGSFDILFLLQALQRTGYPMRGFFSGVSLVGLAVNTPNGRVTFADSYFLIQSPLAKLGKWVDLPKLDFDHTTEHPFETYAPYCFRDCEILFNAIQRFSDTVNQLGITMRLTVGANAVALAKQRGAAYKLPPAIDRKLVDGFFGGRTEDVRRGVYHDVNCFDINSAYPWAMTQPIPGRFVGITRKEPKPPYFVAARDVRVSGAHGAIPVRTRLGLFYPVGVIPNAILTDVEAALCDSFEPVCYFVFDVNRHLIKLAEDLYKLRTQGGASSLVYKILANSIYGKFAEKPEKDALIFNPDKLLPNSEMMRPGVYRVAQYVPVPHRNIATAGYITSLVRAKIFGFMDRETLYVDTDGFWTRQNGYEVGGGLGELKLEARARELEILQPKMYRYLKEEDGGLSEIIKAKGYRGLTRDGIERLKRGEQITLPPSMRRVKGMLRRNLDLPTYREVKKTMLKIRPKRRDDGTPWDYSELHGEQTEE